MTATLVCAALRDVMYDHYPFVPLGTITNKLDLRAKLTNKNYQNRELHLYVFEILTDEQVVALSKSLMHETQCVDSLI